MKEEIKPDVNIDNSSSISDEQKRFLEFYNSLSPEEQKRYDKDSSKTYAKRLNELKKASNPKKFLIRKILLISGILTSVIVFSLLTFLVIIPNVAYKKGMSSYENGDYEKALNYFKTAKTLKKGQKYFNLTKAEIALKNGNKKEAALYYGSVAEDEYFQKSKELFWNDHLSQEPIAYLSEKGVYAGITNDGKIKLSDADKIAADTFYKFHDWNNLCEVKAHYDSIVGLKQDGTVIVTGNNNYAKGVSKWTNIVSVYIDFKLLIGLRADGTLEVLGNKDVKNKLSKIKNVINFDITSVEYHANYDITTEYEMVLVTSDGNVKHLATKDFSKDLAEELAEVNNAITISIYNQNGYGTSVVVLYEDGTTKCFGNTSDGKADANNWTNIKEAHIFNGIVCGITNDGNFVAAGKLSDENVALMQNPVHILDINEIAIIDKDGKVILTKYSEIAIKDWDNILISKSNK